MTVRSQLTSTRRAGVAFVLVLLALLGTAGAAQAKDQVVLSGTVNVRADETVGTVVALDGPVNIAGHVTGDVVAISGVVRISGRVDGTVTAVSKQALLSPGAVVGGDLLYGDKKPVIAPGATVHGKVSNEGWTDLASPGVGLAVHVLIWLAVTLSSLALGLALLGLAPRAADAALETGRTRLGASAGWGVALALGLPVLAVLAVATLFALPLGLALLCALIPLAAVGYVTSCWLVGAMVGKPGGGGRIPLFLVGWAILRGIALIPFLGALAWVAATVIGLGVLIVTAWQRGHSAGASAAAPVTPAPA